MADAPAESPAATPQQTPQSGVERERAVINEARGKGPFATLGAFVKLSGPGWLQSAITLGGGSLTGSLYLGVLAGFGLLWLQPLAMVMGIVMLSAIAYVTLSTGKRPFQAIKDHVNPVLAFAWITATMMANFVWCMPQFALGTAALQQNLMTDTFDGMSPMTGNVICVVILFVLAAFVSWFYESGGKGIKIFEMILKGMVGLVVLSFFGVVAKMVIDGQVNLGEIFAGFIPDMKLLTQPAEAFRGPIEATGEFASYWRDKLVLEQQQVMITAAATAVGINMTFLLPYSMLARGWDRDFRGLAIFDLSTGLLIPFLLATTCVVVAAASQFHAVEADGLVSGDNPAANLVGGYNGTLDARLKQEMGAEAFGVLDDDGKVAAREALPLADKKLAAMLVKRDAFNLARALEPLVGETISRYVFGIGVFGMAISTIIILMLINGFVFCELFNQPGNATLHRVGAFAAAVVGAMGPFIWSGEAKLWLAVPTSMIGLAMLPIAYITFFFMMNSKSLLGDALPTGVNRLVWNGLMGLAVALATFGSFWSIKSSPFASVGYGIMGTLVALTLAVHFAKNGTHLGVGAVDESGDSTGA